MYYVNVYNHCTLNINCPGGVALLKQQTGNDDIQSKYFQTGRVGNPYNPMNIYVVEATINSMELGIGDEIAAFDENTCLKIDIAQKHVR